jgi:hypothetical protein
MQKQSSTKHEELFAHRNQLCEHFPKQIFEVWHFNNWELSPEGYLHPDRAIARWHNKHEQYIKVAEVEARNLGQVWGITQNGAETWTKRPEIKWRKSHDMRSTSVGDVLVQNGKAWLVAWEGFAEIPEQTI